MDVKRKINMILSLPPLKYEGLRDFVLAKLRADDEQDWIDKNSQTWTVGSLNVEGYNGKDGKKEG